MSPARRRQQFVPARPRSEVVTTIAVGVGIVVVTALVVWLMRPGPRGYPGRGGLFNRQPRMTILLLLAAAALGSVVTFVLRRTKPLRLGARGSIGAGSTGVVVLAVLAGIFWPGGAVRHWPKIPKVNQIPAASVPSSVPHATIPTTKKGVSTTSKPSVSTSSSTPPTSSPPTSSPKSSPPTTKGR